MDVPRPHKSSRQEIISGINHWIKKGGLNEFINQDDVHNLVQKVMTDLEAFEDAQTEICPPSELRSTFFIFQYRLVPDTEEGALYLEIFDDDQIRHTTTLEFGSEEPSRELLAFYLIGEAIENLARFIHTIRRGIGSESPQDLELLKALGNHREVLEVLSVWTADLISGESEVNFSHIVLCLVLQCDVSRKALLEGEQQAMNTVKIIEDLTRSTVLGLALSGKHLLTLEKTTKKGGEICLRTETSMTINPQNNDLVVKAITVGKDTHTLNATGSIEATPELLITSMDWLFSKVLSD